MCSSFSRQVLSRQIPPSISIYQAILSVGTKAQANSDRIDGAQFLWAHAEYSHYTVEFPFFKPSNFLWNFPNSGQFFCSLRTDIWEKFTPIFRTLRFCEPNAISLVGLRIAVSLYYQLIISVGFQEVWKSRSLLLALTTRIAAVGDENELQADQASQLSGRTLHRNCKLMSWAQASL